MNEYEDAREKAGEAWGALLAELWKAAMIVAPLLVLFCGLMTGWYLGSGEWWSAVGMAAFTAFYLFLYEVVPDDLARVLSGPSLGTRTVLYGYHTFWLHPWFVALGWWRTFGRFPTDPRLWVAFVVHDLGYWGLPNLDGEEGEQHPEWGARVMERWFDRYWRYKLGSQRWRPGVWASHLCDWIWGDIKTLPYNATSWYAFVRYHSRFLARQDGKRYSALCVADKLAIVLYPRALFLRLVRATGEVEEYMKTALRRGEHPTAESIDRWYNGMTEYVRTWWAEHRDLRPDRMTSDKSKEARPGSSRPDGVWE